MGPGPVRPARLPVAHLLDPLAVAHQLLQGGQGVFGIGIGGAMRGLAGSISEFPAETVSAEDVIEPLEDELAARRRARASRRTG